ncbi:MAG: sulfotransferase family protein [Steroidobacteraceae bacterium]
MPLAIIGAGQGRTGTTSLKLALEELGFGPCYHGTDMYRNHPPGWHPWTPAFDGEPVDWDVIFGGYKATVDSPACLFYRELADKYPAARVILTRRESNAWFASAQATYLSPAALKTPDAVGLAQYRSAAKGTDCRIRYSTRRPRRYRRFRTAQGVPVPNTPFPHANLKGIALARGYIRLDIFAHCDDCQTSGRA